MKLKNSLSTVFVGIVLSLAFGATGCVQTKPSLASVEPKTSAEAAKPAASNLTETQIATAQKLIEKSPNTAEGYNRLAAGYIRLARETGDFSINSTAEAAVNRALEVEPNNQTAQKLKASLLLTFHRFQEALNYGFELQKKYPQDSIVYGVLTDANVELGNYAAAVETAQKMVDLKPDMQSYARVSHIRSLHGDAPGAIQAMDTAAKIADPMDKEAQAWCLVQLGNELFKTGKYDLAERAYDRALQTFPDYHFALAGKGRARAANNDFETAIKLLSESNNRVPNVENIIFLADAHAKIGNREEAEKQYQLAEFIEQKLGNLDQRTLALLWADRNAKTDEALEIARREHAARKDIYTADVYAWCLYKKGDFAEAKKIIGEAMRLQTKDARIFYHAGMIENALGNKKAAAQFLKQALETNPAFDLLQAEIARKTLADLKQNA